MNNTNTTMSTSLDAGLIGAFTDVDRAEQAIAQLGKQGVPASAISLVSQGLSSKGKVHGFVTTGDVATVGSSNGAWVGGIFGILTGAALVFTPAGPVVVAGGLAAALLGGLEGAGVGAGIGAVTGAIFGHFVAKRHIPKIESRLTSGEYLVVVNGDDDVRALANAVLADAGADVSDHTGE